MRNLRSDVANQNFITLEQFYLWSCLFYTDEFELRVVPQSSGDRFGGGSNRAFCQIFVFEVLLICLLPNVGVSKLSASAMVS